MKALGVYFNFLLRCCYYYYCTYHGLKNSVHIMSTVLSNSSSTL